MHSKRAENTKQNVAVAHQLISKEIIRQKKESSNQVWSEDFNIRKATHYKSTWPLLHILL